MWIYIRIEGWQTPRMGSRSADSVETNVHLSRDLRTVVDEIVESAVVTNARNT